MTSATLVIIDSNEFGSEYSVLTASLSREEDKYDIARKFNSPVSLRSSATRAPALLVALRKLRDNARSADVDIRNVNNRSTNRSATQYVSTYSC